MEKWPLMELKMRERELEKDRDLETDKLNASVGEGGAGTVAVFPG